MSERPFKHGRDHRQGGADPTYASGGEGIRFDFDNVGGWLDITTTGADGSSRGMYFATAKKVLWDLSGSGSDGLFEVDGDSVTLDAQGTTGQLLLHSNYDAFLTVDRALVIEGGVDAVAGSGVLVQATHGDLDLEASAASATVGIGAPGSGGVVSIGASETVNITSQVNAVRINVAAGTPGGNPNFEVYNGANPILVIDNTTSPPTYHGATGGSWVWNL